MIYTGLNRTGEIEQVYAHGGSEVSAVYGGIGESNPIYYSRKTLTGTSPLTFKALGLPLSDYLISGNTIQDGTPSPDMPVDVVGCGVRTENLFSSAWEQGGINVDTGQNEPSAFRVRTAGYIEVSPNKIYSFSRSIYYYFMNLRFYSADKSFIDTGSFSSIRLIAGDNVGNPMSDGTSFCCFEIINPNIRYMRIGDESNTLSTKYMMVEGEYTKQTMPKYEPYGYKLPLTVNGTEYPIYLGQVETTRRIKKLVLTGEEEWYGSAKYRMGLYGQIGTVRPFCTHYIGVTYTGYSYMQNGQISVNGETARTLCICDTTNQTSIADWKSYLAAQYAAGTPVTVWYVLAEPETGIVNEPLHKIGGYADTISMAQAGVTIPTLPGNNTFSVDTTLPPSQVSITGHIKPVTS